MHTNSLVGVIPWDENTDTLKHAQLQHGIRDWEISYSLRGSRWARLTPLYLLRRLAKACSYCKSMQCKIFGSTNQDYCDEFGKMMEKEFEMSIAPDFKNKARYTPYLSPKSQISHIATNKGNINRQCLTYNELNIKDITLDSKQWKDTCSLGESSKSMGTTKLLSTSLNSSLN